MADPTSHFIKTFGATILTALAGRWATVIKAEVEIAKIELEIKLKELARGAVLLIIAATFVFFMVGTLIATAVLALSNAMDPWVAALVVSGGLFFWVLVFGMWGAVKINRNKDIKPKRSIDRIKSQLGG
jgi:uncharacterized membrane protein YqjE